MKRVVLAAALTALAGGAVLTQSPASAVPLPSGTTGVPVITGKTTTGINAALRHAGSIQGTVTAAFSDRAIQDVDVRIYTPGGTLVADRVTDAEGRYVVVGLNPTATGYVVCARTTDDTVTIGGDPLTGYTNQCYRGVLWTGTLPLPRTRRLVPLASDQQRSVNFSMRTAAGISGTVTSGSGAELRRVTVLARNRSTGRIYHTQTSGRGHYIVRNLPATRRGYQVCFDGSTAVTSSSLGYLAECLKDVPWAGRGRFPAGARAISVRAGANHRRISAALHRAASIAGTVRGSDGTPIDKAQVIAFSSTGHVLRTARTDRGSYRLRGLRTARGVRVCVRPGVDRAAQVSYRGTCFRDAAWSGGRLPRSAAGVDVTVGHVRARVSLRVATRPARPISISGKISKVDAGGRPQTAAASVFVFTPSGRLVSAVENARDGTYAINGLAPATYVVCASVLDRNTIERQSPATGNAPRCYVDQSWTGGGVPSNATRVTGRSGQKFSDVDILLREGGAISGHVVDASTGSPTDALVEVFDRSHQLVTVVRTQQLLGINGSFDIRGLAGSSTYTVCFDGRFQSGPTYGYAPQCFKGRPWMTAESALAE